jgi:hypothetical protein
MIAGSEKAPHVSEALFSDQGALAMNASLAMAVTNIWLAVLIFALVVCQLLFANWTAAFFAMPLWKSAGLFLSCNVGVYVATYLTLFVRAKRDTKSWQ